MHELTSERFKAVFGHINAALVDKPLSEPMVNLWHDFQIWKRHEIFGNGVIALCGEWPEKSIQIAENFAEVVHQPTLQTLPEIPSAIFACFNPKDQARFIREVIIPYEFHFRLSRNPPPLLLMGAHRGAPSPPGPISILEFIRVENSSSWLRARVTPLLGEMFRVTDLRVSGPPEHLDAEGPGYILFALELAMRYMF